MASGNKKISELPVATTFDDSVLAGVQNGVNTQFPDTLFESAEFRIKLGLNNVLNNTFETIATAAAENLSEFDVVEILKFDSASDTVRTFYKKVPSQPSHTGKFVDGVSNWFEIIPGERGLNAKSRGALGQGISTITTDTTCLQEAAALSVALNSILYVPKGDYYLSSQMISMTSGTGETFKMEGHGPEATKLYMNFGGTSLITVGSGTGQITLTQTLTAPVSAGGHTLTVASTTGYAERNLVRILDTTRGVYDQTAGVQIAVDGQIATVKAVTDATHLEIEEAFEFPYTTSATVQKVAVTEGHSFKNFSIRGTVSSEVSNTKGIGIQHARDVTFENVHFYDMYEDSLSLFRTYNFTSRGVVGRYNKYTLSGTPYVHRLQEVAKGLIDGGQQDVGRHYVTTAANTTNTNLESAHVIVTNCIGSGSFLSFLDTHPGDNRNFIFRGNLIVDPSSNGIFNGRGLQSRGRWMTIEDNTMSGYGDFGITANSGNGLRIINNVIRGYASAMSITNVSDVEIRDNLCEECATVGIKIVAPNLTPGSLNYRIRNNRVKGDPSTGAFYFDVWDDTCEFDSDNIAPSAAIEFAGAAAASLTTGHIYGTPDLIKAQNIDLNSIGASSGQTPTSGVPSVVPIYLKKGMHITKLGFLPGGTASAQTNLWMALYNKSGVLKAVTTDALTVVPTTDVYKQLTLQSVTVGATVCPAQFIVPKTDWYYLMIMQKATTALLRGAASNAAIGSVTPKPSSIDSHTGLSTVSTCPETLGTLTADANIWWGTVA